VGKERAWKELDFMLSGSAEDVLRKRVEDAAAQEKA
jgi:hypothetical protein